MVKLCDILVFKDCIEQYSGLHTASKNALETVDCLLASPLVADTKVPVT